MSKKVLKQIAIELIENNLKKYFNTTFAHATKNQLFKAIASAAMDELFDIRSITKKPDLPRSAPKKNIKALHYLTIEILLGRTLENTLANLGWDKVFEVALKSKGIEIEDIYSIETDAGLGNGGLGRLAACYMDSLATLNYPATAHCIKYDFGLFKQRIIDGHQVEFLDEWLNTGNVWLNARTDEAVTVRFGGTVSYGKGSDGRLKFNYIDAVEIDAIPYNMMLSGHNTKFVGTLKLWSAKNKNRGDVHLSRDELANYMKECKEIEMINSVLYPANEILRLNQQYFLCSASMQCIVNWHLRKGVDLKNLPDYVAIHINDTHPTMCIPELMRILMDEHSFSWDDAWSIVTKCVSYTNHTVLQEALEVWESNLLAHRVPRIHQIICEIDRRFRDQISRNRKMAPFVEELAVVSNHSIRMANLAVIASHKVNGVSKIHSEILKSSLFGKFAELTPDKFINITNGVTHRRWLVQANPLLAEFLTSYIGSRYYTDSETMQELSAITFDHTAYKKINQIKLSNKKEFAQWLFKYQGVQINPETRFDVHIKRIHEYKRQLLNALRIIHIVNELRKNPDADVTPQTFIFAGKAASSYYMAKRIIKLIYQISAEIDKDPKLSKVLKVVFVENFSVTVAEKLLPAVDVSVQISLAGQEASGTGNMKAVMNGGLMLCTYDGANAEICDRCHEEGSCSNFMFGMRTNDIEEVWSNGYHPIDIYNANPKIMAVIDALNQGFNGESFQDIASYLLGTSNSNDNYMCLGDFEDFIRAHDEMDNLYRSPSDWARAVLKNISSIGYFSSDRAVREYVAQVWGLTKLK